MENGNEEGAQELINNKLKNLDPKDYPDINRSLIFKMKANPIKYSLPENDIK